MTYREAYEHAQTMKNYFSAFARLEEVLILAAGAERAAKEYEERVQSASAVAESWRQQAEGQRATFERETVELNAKRAAADEEHRAVMGGYHTEQEKLREEITSLKMRRDQLQAAVDALGQTAASV